jgi:hypothetical protein
MSVQQEQNKQTGRTGVAPQGTSLAEQVKGFIEQAKEAQKARGEGKSQAQADFGAEGLAQQEQMAQAQQQQVAGGDMRMQMEAMVQELVSQGVPQEQAIAMVQQQMQGGGQPPQQMPPEGAEAPPMPQPM